MDILEIKKKIKELPPVDLADFFHHQLEESYEAGVEDGIDSEERLNDGEESAENIDFCLNELNEARTRGLTIDELIQDLTIRSCKYIPTIGLSPVAIREAFQTSIFTES